MEKTNIFFSFDGIPFDTKEECLMYENAIKMDWKYMSEYNVLTTEEACKILARSRQQLHIYLKQGKIKPFKPLSNTNLFWRPDVLKLAYELDHRKMSKR